MVDSRKTIKPSPRNCSVRSIKKGIPGSCLFAESFGDLVFKLSVCRVFTNPVKGGSLSDIGKSIRSPGKTSRRKVPAKGPQKFPDQWRFISNMDPCAKKKKEVYAYSV